MNHTNLINFTTQLSALLRAGVSLFNALRLIESNASKNDLSIIAKIIQLIQLGQPLSKALCAADKKFDGIYCGLIEVGEYSGTLPEILEYIKNYLEKQAALQNKLRKALTYPVLVILIAMSLVGGMFAWIIPTFESVFTNANLELPSATAFLLQASTLFSKYGGLALLSFGGSVVILLFFWEKNLRFQQWIDQVILKIPLFGTISQLALISQWSMVMEILLRSGIPLLKAIQISGKTSNHWALHDTNVSLFNSLSKGLSLHQAAKIAQHKYQLFTPICLQLFQTGEQTGSLTEMIGHLTQHHQQALDQKIDVLLEMLEPILISILGIIIGGMVISLYLPLFQLGQLS